MKWRELCRLNPTSARTGATSFSGMSYKIEIERLVSVPCIDGHTGSAYQDRINPLFTKLPGYKACQVLDPYLLPINLHRGLPSLRGLVRLL